MEWRLSYMRGRRQAWQGTLLFLGRGFGSGRDGSAGRTTRGKNGGVERVQELARRERGFIENQRGPCLESFLNHVRHICVRENDDWRFAELGLGADFLENVDPIHLRQH